MRIRNFIVGLTMAPLMLLVLATAALAQDTSVSVPWGDWVVVAADFVSSVAVPVLLLLFARLMAILPEPIAAFLRTMQVEQLLSRSTDFALEAVKGAAKGKRLSFEVGNTVVAEATQYAIEQGPSALIKWVGGERAIRRMILARLDLDEDVAGRDIVG